MPEKESYIDKLKGEFFRISDEETEARSNTSSVPRSWRSGGKVGLLIGATAVGEWDINLDPKKGELDLSDLRNREIMGFEFKPRSLHDKGGIWT